MAGSDSVGPPGDRYAGPNADPSVIDGRPIEAVESAFRVYEVRRDGERVLYYGEPLVAADRVVEHAWEPFRSAGYEIDMRRKGGEYVLVAEPVDLSIDGIPWTNVVLFVLTVVSTLFAGTLWYHVDVGANPLGILRAWPFTAALLFVLGVHELGHYVMSRYHGVRATLPYFIPVPSIIGTMGAVIRMKGRMPDRKALFDIGVAGPLAGLAATVLVTVVGLFLDPVTVPQSVVESSEAVQVQIGFPPLLRALAAITGQPLEYADPAKSVNPVVIAGWVGMFVTFLNMLPVGQLDGGHVFRAILGKRQETVASLVPAVLFTFAATLYYSPEVLTWYPGFDPAGAGNAAGLWMFWGLFATLLAAVGPANPVDDGTLDHRRKLVGIASIVLGALCFAPIPVAIVGG
ncbi:hypothetical protein BRD17_03850 [Halobacteriales archaeon SW_7_68_16]|nr:MAG: hypothetical protein BRD17_03850 [Halobacteriales archaeon SW_7_68_16]